MLTWRLPTGEAVCPADRDFERLSQQDAKGMIDCLSNEPLFAVRMCVPIGRRRRIGNGEPIASAALMANVVRPWEARTQALARTQAETALRLDNDRQERANKALRARRQFEGPMQRASGGVQNLVEHIVNDEDTHFRQFRQHYYDTLNYVAIRCNRMVKVRATCITLHALPCRASHL